MFAHAGKIPLRRKLRVSAGIVLVALALFSMPALSAEAVTSGLAASEQIVGESTNRTTDRNAPRASTPVSSHTRSKAGFLAGAGLVIISLLALAFGLALVRAFKQR